MANPVYATFTDEHGMQIKAAVQIHGREGSAEGHAFEYTVSIPADRNSGQLTAIRKHGSVILTKTFDSSSPVLFDACCRGKTLHSVRLDWYKINEQGTEERYFSHLLTGVKVVKVRQYMLNVKDPRNDGYGHQEMIHLRFKRIELNHLDGNIKATDDWTAART